MTGIFICLGTLPSFALCPVTKKIFQVKSTFSRSKLKAECWHMQEQARKGARLAEGQFGTGSNKLRRMKKGKCLKLAPKLSTNLDNAQVNLLPLAGSGCSDERWEGASVFCTERADTPQKKGCNPALVCSLLCGTSSSKAHQTCSFDYGIKNVSRSLKFLPFAWLSYLTSGKKIKLCLRPKITEFLKKKILAFMWIPYKVWERKKRGKF